MAVRGIIVLALFSLAACVSPAQSYCATQDECGKLGRKSEAQCAADEQKRVDDTREKPECQSVADAYEDLMACRGALSCDELKLTGDESLCKKEGEALLGAGLSNLGCAIQAVF